MDGILPVGRAQTHGALSNVTDGLFHLGRTFVGAGGVWAAVGVWRLLKFG